uniref:Putative secreted protein n=1 Tax=Anopheles darlingi TaxID=43151 RepID=A0A2M4DFV0_ANODA
MTTGGTFLFLSSVTTSVDPFAACFLGFQKEEAPPLIATTSRLRKKWKVLRHLLLHQHLVRVTAEWIVSKSPFIL